MPPRKPAGWEDMARTYRDKCTAHPEPRDSTQLQLFADEVSVAFEAAGITFKSLQTWVQQLDPVWKANRAASQAASAAKCRAGKQHCAASPSTLDSQHPPSPEDHSRDPGVLPFAAFVMRMSCIVLPQHLTRPSLSQIPPTFRSISPLSVHALFCHSI
jgi:hypothetical protein